MNPVKVLVYARMMHADSIACDEKHSVIFDDPEGATVAALVRRLCALESFAGPDVKLATTSVLDPDFDVYVTASASDRLVHLSRYEVVFNRKASALPADSASSPPCVVLVDTERRPGPTIDSWVNFFRACGIPRMLRRTFAETFLREHMRPDYLSKLNESDLRELGVCSTRNQRRILAYIASTPGSLLQSLEIGSLNRAPSSMPPRPENVYNSSPDVFVDIMRFLDYTTLVAMSAASSRFHCLRHAQAHVMPHKRGFCISIAADYVELSDGSDHWTKITYHQAQPSSFMDALREIGSLLGFHDVIQLSIMDTWNSLPLQEVFSNLPCLRHVRHLRVRCLPAGIVQTSVRDFDAFLNNFVAIKRLTLRARSDGCFKLPVLFAHRFARHVAELITHALHPDDIDVNSLATIADYCVDFSGLAADAPRLVKIGRLPSDFVNVMIRRIVTLRQRLIVTYATDNATQLPAEEFEMRQLQRDERSITQYTHKATASVSVFYEGTSCTITNVSSFNPFVR